MSSRNLPPTIDLAGLRCLLFTPADRAERFAKAVASGADGVILDLEDGVGPAAKDVARTALLAALSNELSSGGVIRAIRLNHVTTQAGLQDLLALRQAVHKPAVVMLPKVETTAELDITLAHLGSLTFTPALVALIESARGLENAAEIGAHAACGALAFGGADLAANLRAHLAWEPMLSARSRIVQAARAGNVACWDMPFLDIWDVPGLSAEADAAKSLGFDGKLAIHPGQVVAINAAFSPTQGEIAHAERVNAAFRCAEGGACMVDGRMVDRPVYTAAQRVLQAAQRAGEGQ